MRNTKSGWFGLVLLFATAAIATQTHAQLRYVPVGIPTISISSGSFIIAKEAGFYKEEGLNVDLVVMRGAPAVQALIGGTVPFSSSGGAGLLPMVRGAPLRVIFTTFSRPMFWLYSKSEIKTIEELRGKKVGVSSIGSGPDSLLRILLKKQGLEGGRDVAILATGPGPARFFALKAGATDAAVLNEQAALMAQAEGYRQLFSFTKGEDFVEVQGSIVVQDSLFESDPVFVQKFTRATLKGLLYLKENRSGSIAIHSRVLKIDQPTATRIYDLALPGTTVDGTVSEEVQKKSIDQIVERTPDIKEAPATKKVFDFSLTRKLFKELQASGWKANR
ncbi:MAG TPA: ABC transporter substrate-binding protein [Candidatus Binatia bacterium]|jgi:NitT/TauT family transport system substrate-binding protein